jgi:tetratricopeptide (TPR) repeat protein
LNLIQLGIPFEAWLELFVGNSKFYNMDHYFLDIFASKEFTPNTNHYLIAELVKRGIVSEVYTVNFDCLIERALSDVGLSINKDYSVVYNSKGFDSTRVNDLPQVIKLHGSAVDFESICITIHSIARQEDLSSRNRMIDKMMKCDDCNKLLILGYSCSDFFDILPSIESSKEPHCEIYFMNHQNNSIECSILNESWPGKKQCGYSGYSINGRTDDFMQDIVKKLNINSIEFNKETIQCCSIRPEQALNKYIGPIFESAIYLGQKSLLIGEIYQKAKQYTKCLLSIHNEFTNIEEYGAQRSMQHTKASALFEMGNVEEALLEFDKEINLRILDLFVIAGITDCIEMTIMLASHNYLAILEYLEDFNINRGFQAQEMDIGQYGIVWENTVGIIGAISGCCACLSANNLNESALEILECERNLIVKAPWLETKDMELTLNVLNQIICCQNAMGQFGESIKVSGELIEIAEKTGSLLTLAIGLQNTVPSYILYLDFDTAIEVAKRSLEILSDFKQLDRIAILLQNIMNLSIRLRAIDLCRYAVSVIGKYGYGYDNGLGINLIKYLSDILKLWFDNIEEYHLFSIGFLEMASFHDSQSNQIMSINARNFFNVAINLQLLGDEYKSGLFRESAFILMKKISDSDHGNF